MIPDFDSIFHLVRDPIRQTVGRPEPRPKGDPLPGISFLTRRPKAIPDLIYTPRDVQGFKHLSDARRIEIGLLPRMCFETVKRGASDAGHPDTIILLGLFTDAICETVAGLPVEKVDYLSHRLNRASDAVYHKRHGGWFNEDWTNGKIAMCLYFLACDLTSDGTMELYDGSAMAEGLTRMWAAVEDEAAAFPERVRSAEKQAGKFRRFLAERGYFR